MASPGPPFRVVHPERWRQQVVAWAAQAATLGIREEYLAALKSIQGRLAEAPMTWGDPQYNLRSLGLTVYRGLCRPLQILYAVDQGLRVVYVMHYRPLPGCGLEEV